MTPPFRAEHIGSLLRPAGLRAARQIRAGDALREVEDRFLALYPNPYDGR
jgi:hypothetical protein